MKKRLFVWVPLLLASCSVAPTTAPTTMTPPGNTDATANTPMAPGTLKEPVTVSRLVCKTTKEQRVLEMRAKDEGCELLYTRAGTTRSIATSRAGDAACQAVRGKTQSNLERSGYRCEAN